MWGRTETLEDEEQRVEVESKKIERSANRLCWNRSSLGASKAMGGEGERETMSNREPQTDNKHCIPKGKNRKMRMWQEFRYLALSQRLSCSRNEHIQYSSMLSQLQQHTHTLHLRTVTSGTCNIHTWYIRIHISTRYHTGAQHFAGSLWHAGLEWFAVISQSAVKFKQVLVIV